MGSGIGLFPFHFSPSPFPRSAGGGAKDFTALGGKVGSAGPGVETEEGEGVEVGGDGVKLLTLGVGEVDKDAVLQAGKAEVDRLKAASQEIVLEILDIIGCLGGGGVETPGLGLVKKVVNEVNELAARGGDFGDHAGKGKGLREKGKGRERLDRKCHASEFVPFPLHFFPLP